MCAAALTAILLLGAAALSGMVFAPSHRDRTPLEELRELAEVRFRAAGMDVLSRIAREHLAAAREANLVSRALILRSMGLYLAGLGVLGAQVLLIAIVHLLGI